MYMTHFAHCHAAGSIACCMMAHSPKWAGKWRDHQKGLIFPTRDEAYAFALDWANTTIEVIKDDPLLRIPQFSRPINKEFLNFEGRVVERGGHPTKIPPFDVIDFITIELDSPGLDAADVQRTLVVGEVDVILHFFGK
jgi:hypothetical protein